MKNFIKIFVLVLIILLQNDVSVASIKTASTFIAESSLSYSGISNFGKRPKKKKNKNSKQTKKLKGKKSKSPTSCPAFD